MPRKLGSNQVRMLELLDQHDWSEWAGWRMGSHSETLRVLTSLVKLGLVRVSVVTRPNQGTYNLYQKNLSQER